MNLLLPRFRQDEEERVPRLRRDRGCPSGKVRHPSEAAAIEALLRVREVRIENGDPRPPESAIYPCGRCEGWHLSSSELHPYDLTPVKRRQESESLEAYAIRLEHRIAEQRANILSLVALGHGAGNRATRKRMHTLVAALGLMTERWERERRHREALVEILHGRCRCWWCRLRRFLRMPGRGPEAAQATERAEAS